MIGKLVRFDYGTGGFVPQMIDGIQQSWCDFWVDAGSLGIVICNSKTTRGIDKYLYDVLVDNRLVYQIDHKRLTFLSEGECL